MTELKSLTTPLFLGEEELRQGIELLFYAYRDFTRGPDELLERYGFGRAHHRALHFIGGNPGITVAELLGILRITKQSLSRVLSALVEGRSEEHTSELQSLMRTSYAVFCLKKKKPTSRKL